MTQAAYDQVVNAHHKASLTHEAIAAAAGWQAMKAWNEHKARQGEAVDHAKMKQFMAAASAAFIDRMVETKGLDAIDRHRVRQQAEGHYGQYPEYGQYEQYGNYGGHGHHEHHEHHGHHEHHEHHENREHRDHHEHHEHHFGHHEHHHR